MLIGVLNVDKGTIMEDFLLTNVFFEEEIRAMRAQLSQFIKDEKELEKFLVAGKDVKEYQQKSVRNDGLLLVEKGISRPLRVRIEVVCQPFVSLCVISCIKNLNGSKSNMDWYFRIKDTDAADTADVLQLEGRIFACYFTQKCMGG